MQALSEVRIFLPLRGKTQSPLSDWQSHEIQARFHRVLQSPGAHIQGYNIYEVQGFWCNPKTSKWEDDPVCVVELYVDADFMEDAVKPQSETLKAIAKLSYLSCCGMRQEEFFLVKDRLAMTGKRKGIQIGSGVQFNGDFLEYEKILDPSTLKSILRRTS